MEYKLKKEIDGKEVVINLNDEDCKKIYDYAKNYDLLQDVELVYDIESSRYNITQTTRPNIIEQVLTRYNKMYNDEIQKIWGDCVYDAYVQEFNTFHRGILHIKENDKDYFFYGHYAGVESSSAVRFTKAYEDSQNNKTSIADEIKKMKNSSGESLYLELKFDEAYEILNSFGNKNNIYGAMVTVDVDNEKYTYKSLIGDNSYRIDLDDAVKLVKSISPDTTTNIDNEFHRKIFILLNDTEKYNRAVLVEAGLPPTKYYLQTDLYGLQDAVKGHIETLPQINDDNFAVAFGNEEARLIEMQPNRKFGEDLRNAVCGPFIIVGDNGYGETVSLSHEQIYKYLERFEKPDKFSDKEIEKALAVHFEFVELDNYYKPKQNQRTQKI